VLLNELPAPFYVAEEEVPDSGIIVSRRVQRARWYDGRTYLWIGRSRETGRGAAFQRLALRSDRRCAAAGLNSPVACCSAEPYVAATPPR
jgi:hypothetical protein